MSDELVEAVARAIHDGPLLASDYDFDDPANKRGTDWCRDIARAAIAVVIERCAEVAEDPGFVQARDTEWDTGFNYAKRIIAAAIRKLGESE